MFYAFNHRYGINTTDTHGERIGSLAIFESKKERDEWVADDPYSNGNPCREALTGKEGRHELECEKAEIEGWLGGWKDAPVSDIPTSILVKAHTDMADYFEDIYTD